MVNTLSRGFVLEDKTKILKLTDFKIKEHPDGLDQDFHHYSAFLPNCEYGGFGSSKDPKLAVKKAVSECVERYHFALYSKEVGTNTTSGFAVHETLEAATEASICEAFERDALLTSWLAGLPPKWLDESTLSDLNRSHIQVFRDYDFEIRIGLVCRTNKRFCLVGYLLDQKTEGAVFSAACSKDQSKAVSSILCELRRAATVMINRKNNPDYENSTDLQRKAAYHFDYYLKPNHFKTLSWYVQQSISRVPENHFDINVINLSLKVRPKWDLFLTFASSSDLQGFYFGDPTLRTINRKRLKKLLKVGKRINRNLHILP